MNLQDCARCWEIVNHIFLQSKPAHDLDTVLGLLPLADSSISILSFLQTARPDVGTSSSRHAQCSSRKSATNGFFYHIVIPQNVSQQQIANTIMLGYQFDCSIALKDFFFSSAVCFSPYHVAFLKGFFILLYFQFFLLFYWLSFLFCFVSCFEHYTFCFGIYKVDWGLPSYPEKELILQSTTIRTLTLLCFINILSTLFLNSFVIYKTLRHYCT